MGKRTIQEQVEGRTSDLSKRFDRVEAIRGRFHETKANQGRRADLDVQRVKHGIWLGPRHHRPDHGRIHRRAVRAQAQAAHEGGLCGDTA